MLELIPLWLRMQCQCFTAWGQCLKCCIVQSPILCMIERLSVINIAILFFIGFPDPTSSMEVAFFWMWWCHEQFVQPDVWTFFLFLFFFKLFVPDPSICHNWSKRCEGCLICHWKAVPWTTEKVERNIKIVKAIEVILDNLMNPQFMVYETKFFLFIADLKKTVRPLQKEAAVVWVPSSRGHCAIRLGECRISDQYKT